MILDPKSCIMLPSETTAIVLETLTVIWAAVCVVAVKLIIAKVQNEELEIGQVDEAFFSQQLYT